MDKLTYKTFVWPQNPHTYQEKSIREPQYVLSDGVHYFQGMSGLKRIITGKGTFFGKNAISDFQRLVQVFENGDAGNLQHPQWGIRYCYFTGLELTQEPAEDYVSYQFEFTQASANGQIPY